jgi:signal transduction histidine kinase
MTLTRKFIFFNLSLLTLVVAFGGASIWNAVSMLHSTQATAAEYGALDHAQAASSQVLWLRTNLQAADGRIYRDVKYLVPIRKDLADIRSELDIARRSNDGDYAQELQLADQTAAQLDAAERDFAAQPNPPAGSPEATAALDRATQSLDALIKLAPAAARRHVTVAAAGVHDRLLWTCLWLVVTLGVSSFIHMRQYRALVRPLLWLRDDMRQSALHQHRLIEPRVDGEFREVAAYFNGLARELAELYKSLEDKVIARSRELVRSERLASVGFLAAGVAHEINNPLSVISGYAELAEKNLHQVFASPGSSTTSSEAELAAEADALENALQAQNIIREEAFRCKEITSRLLSLARGNGDGRQLLSLADVARQVGTLTKGLRNYRNRSVVIDFSEAETLPVVANPTEMKQVLLNLTVNALEAVADRGTVRIGGQRAGDSVELWVQDNGKGMTPEVLHQIFEPFFTAKRGSNEPGTGLGLSITFAIIENHGGSIRAQSDGPGKGSRFTITLPAAKAAARNGTAHALNA